MLNGPCRRCIGLAGERNGFVLVLWGTGGERRDEGQWNSVKYSGFYVSWVDTLYG